MSFFQLTQFLQLPCVHCGAKIPLDEMENVSRDLDGDPICDVCYYDQYHFRCAVCDEYEHNRHRDNVMIVFDVDVIPGYQPGLYQIVDLPYYADGMITGYVIESAVKRIGPLPEAAVRGWYPAGHLCRPCIKKYTPRCTKPKVQANWHANG